MEATIATEPVTMDFQALMEDHTLQQVQTTLKNNPKFASKLLHLLAGHLDLDSQDRTPAIANLAPLEIAEEIIGIGHDLPPLENMEVPPSNNVKETERVSFEAAISDLPSTSDSFKE